ncbi:MAG: cysteine desulfurase [Coleofasciculaceae cyanobacterium RL_1_1]|nr:cysteine desulfurase [Coleofasciculaceae cyanobacterium RL_1_1]
MQIYLDHSATTPPRSEVIAVMQQALASDWGNPSSLHAWGKRAATWVETARLQVAASVNAPPESIAFTSGGTESNNWVFAGIQQRVSDSKPSNRSNPSAQSNQSDQSAPHVIISQIEHSAIRRPAQALEQQGWRVTYLPVDRMGRLDPQRLAAAIAPETVLVSLIYGQSEVGTLQPIAELAAIARERGVLFHTDAVQVMGRVTIDLESLPVDFLSMSSHKLYGPKGVGALYIRPGCKLAPLLLGGGQESGLRSGTQAVPNIAGFGVAAELAMQERVIEVPRLERLRDRLFDRLAHRHELQPTGHREQRLPHHVSFCLIDPLLQESGITGQSLVKQLDLAGIAASSGSACNSGTIAPSAVLTAMGYDDRTARGALRLTLGRDTTEADIDWTVIAIEQILDRLQPKTRPVRPHLIAP